jgi:CheY-like chemotaxis protein
MAACGILVVEDEWLVASMIEELLEDAGYQVLGPVGSVADALAIIDTQAVTAAVLDVNLGNEQSFAIADRLEAIGVPFLLMTGYTSADLPLQYRSKTILEKPITAPALLSELHRKTAGCRPMAFGRE